MVVRCRHLSSSQQDFLHRWVQEVAAGWRICGVPLGDLLASLLGGQQSCAPCWELSCARLMGDSLASLFGRSAKLSSLLGAQLRQTLECSAGLHLRGQPPWASLYRGAQLHHIFSTLPITFPSHAKPLGRVVCES